MMSIYQSSGIKLRAGANTFRCVVEGVEEVQCQFVKNILTTIEQTPSKPERASKTKEVTMNKIMMLGLRSACRIPR